MKSNLHIGSSFDDFLQEEGLLAEAEAAAVKRVIAHQIEQEMTERRLSKSALATAMRTSRSSLDRLLDPTNASVTLLTLETVAFALGKKLKVQFDDADDRKPIAVVCEPKPEYRAQYQVATGKARAVRSYATRAKPKPNC